MIEPASVSVLVAEDDPRLAEVLSATLIASGYGVTVAHSGDDALSLLSSQRVDLLITDINMPGQLNGWSLAEEARLIHRGLCVIYTTSGRQDQARQVTGSHFIPKPYRPRTIVDMVKRILGHRTQVSPLERQESER